VCDCVRWWAVCAPTALGLPLVSIVMLLMRLHENALVSCVLYLVAVFQALWLIGEFCVFFGASVHVRCAWCGVSVCLSLSVCVRHALR